MKTKTRPAEANPELAGVRELLDALQRRPGRFLWARLAASYVLFGGKGTVFERLARYNAAAAISRADGRLRERHGVRLRAYETALLRVIELSEPSDGSYRSPVEVVGKHIEEPAARLVKTGKARRGDVLGVERHPLGNHIRVGKLKGAG